MPGPNRTDRLMGLALIVSLLQLGCGSAADVPGLEAKAELSNARIEKEFGSDVLKVDYEFTHGLPVRGWQYQLQVIWPDGETSETANYMNETQTSGTLEGELRYLSFGNDDKDLRLKLTLRVLDNDRAEYVLISNSAEVTYSP